MFHVKLSSIKSMIDHPRVQPEPMSGCWLWTGAQGKYRHGFVYRRGKVEVAHRVSWEMERGPIPDGLQVLHKCNTGCCLNPDHLYIGTPADNGRDMKNCGSRKGKNVGEDHYSSKLTKDEVIAIRASNESRSALARKYGVRKQSIDNIVHRRSWKHV